MKHTYLLNICWFMLCMLTISSYTLAEAHLTAYLSPFILGIAGLKALLIGYFFMELRQTRWFIWGSFVLFFGILSSSLILCLKGAL